MWKKAILNCVIRREIFVWNKRKHLWHTDFLFVRISKIYLYYHWLTPIFWEGLQICPYNIQGLIIICQINTTATIWECGVHFFLNICNLTNYTFTFIFTHDNHLHLWYFSRIFCNTIADFRGTNVKLNFVSNSFYKNVRWLFQGNYVYFLNFYVIITISKALKLQFL